MEERCSAITGARRRAGLAWEETQNFWVRKENQHRWKMGSFCIAFIFPWCLSNNMTFSILHWTAFAFSLGHYIFPDIQHLNTYLWCFLRLVLVVFLEPVRKGLLDCDWNFPSYQFSKSNSVKRILLVWHKIYHCWVVLAWSVERRQQYWAGKLRRRKLPLNIGSRKLNIQALT